MAVSRFFMFLYIFLPSYSDNLHRITHRHVLHGTWRWFFVRSTNLSSKWLYTWCHIIITSWPVVDCGKRYRFTVLNAYCTLGVCPNVICGAVCQSCQRNGSRSLCGSARFRLMGIEMADLPPSMIYLSIFP